MTKSERGPGNARPRPRNAADDPIAAGLRRLWSEAEAEPVPEDLIDLITQIDALAAGKSGDGTK